MDEGAFLRCFVAVCGFTWCKLTGNKQAQEGPDSNTPSNAATPTGSVPASLSRAESTSGATGKTGGNKKKRATEKDDDDEKAPKRGKITYARD